MMRKKDWFDDFMEYKMSSSFEKHSPTPCNQQSVTHNVIGLLVILRILLKSFF